ncbi:RHS repeat domain-containing protein [Schlesneria sp.]|uniref:RHS repeat domain-containing protein n=1 Tax=Schlesneria sp. TaxID=2762018 RepID=UPI002F24035A
MQYSYANGSANSIRPTTLTYPNGRAITIGYGTSGGINDAASRVDALIDGATTLVNYAYLGLGTTVQTTYPQPSLQYTLLGSSSGTSPAGDIYWGLDQFGRIIDSRWYRTTTNVDTDRIKYGYDRASNRIWRQNPVATASSAQYDELYTNDGLQRLKDMQRGTLNGTNTAIPSPTFAQCWTLDPTGNWRGFNESTSGSSWTLTQARTSNTVNEITAISTPVGLAWAVPAYDAAGNMTTMPRQATPWTSQSATYDAWNRLISVKAGATDIQQNQYDARNFRTVILNYTSGVLSETRHSYFTSNWRCIEERVGASTSAERQFIWGARYIDDLVLRERDTTGAGALNERFYALQDANWNMSAITTAGALVGERFAYNPYGRTLFMSSAYVTRSISAFTWETTFCGYRYDSGAQLFSVRFRAYHAVLGSWLQRDPLGLKAGSNLYRYVRNSPFSQTDPLGLQDNFLTDVNSVFKDAVPNFIDQLDSGIDLPFGAVLSGHLTEFSTEQFFSDFWKKVGEKMLDAQPDPAALWVPPMDFTSQFQSLLQSTAFAAVQEQANFKVDVNNLSPQGWMAIVLGSVGCASVLQETHGLGNLFPHLSQTIPLSVPPKLLPPNVTITAKPTFIYNTPEYARNNPGAYPNFSLSGSFEFTLKLPKGNLSLSLPWGTAPLTLDNWSQLNKVFTLPLEEAKVNLNFKF